MDCRDFEMSLFHRDTVAEFIDEPSWTARAKQIERAAALYVDGALDEEDAETAVEIFRVALFDGEPLVRRVLAETLKHATRLPDDIVQALARDIGEVAAPFLKCSPLLDADDLAEIARDGSAKHRQAVFCRPRTLAGARTASTRQGDTPILGRSGLFRPSPAKVKVPA